MLRILLPFIWPLLSIVISGVQLVVMTQPEWIVRGTTSMGLFALCSPTSCIVRDGSAAIGLLCLFGGAISFFLSTLVLIPYLLCTMRAAPLRIIANVQFVAALLIGVTIVSLPFDMADVGCSMSELLKSTTCRVGWAYAVSSVAALLSMCCPVLGRLVAEDRSFLYAVVPRGSRQEKHTSITSTSSQEFYL